jgi:hypothetical protein
MRPRSTFDPHENVRQSHVGVNSRVEIAKNINGAIVPEHVDSEDGMVLR